MSVGECLRVQGISNRKFVGVTDNRIREMVGNSMCVATVSAVVKAAFRRVRDMQIIHDEPPVSHAFASTVAPHGGEKSGNNIVSQEWR